MKYLAKAVMAVGCTAVLVANCTTPPGADGPHQPTIVIDRDRGEVRLAGHVQKTSAKRMTDWGAKNQALLGAKGGKYHNDFVFLTDAPVSDIHRALLELGAEPAKAAEGEMRGAPVEILIQWTVGDRTRVLPYQGFFQHKKPEGSEELVTPWEPRFVFHGMGADRGVATGCIACPAYCPGGIIGALTKSTPTLRADWEKLPQPGTRITAVIRIVRPTGLPR